MRKIFLDTVGILALVNKRDALHKKAVQANSQLLVEHVNFITTDYILVEVGNALAKNKTLAIKTIDYLTESEDIKLIRITDEIFNRAIEIYKKYIDKDWGLPDATSFVIMEQFKMKDAFTNDKHFRQYGFNVLLRKL